MALKSANFSSIVRYIFLWLRFGRFQNSANPESFTPSTIETRTLRSCCIHIVATIINLFIIHENCASRSETISREYEEKEREGGRETNIKKGFNNTNAAFVRQDEQERRINRFFVRDFYNC